MEQQGDTLVEALSYFQVSAQIESIMQGPAVTQFGNNGEPWYKGE